MRTCACLYGSVILQPSSSLTSIQFQKQQQQRYRYLNLPSFPIRLLTSCLSPLSTTTTTASVIQRDLEVQLDDAVSSQNENHATIELETQPNNEEKELPPSVVLANQDTKTTRLKKKKEQNDDSSFDNRFKLRNGKEVFEEKTYLVGVERKGDVRDSFGIEESLSELEQLADTAGLLVVGSTYQK